MENILNILDSRDNRKIQLKLAEIADRMVGDVYSYSDVILMLAEINQVDLRKFDYEVREQVLYLVCEIVENYRINDVNILENIFNQKNYIESDLQEYIDEIYFCITTKPPHRQA